MSALKSYMFNETWGKCSVEHTPHNLLTYWLSGLITLIHWGGGEIHQIIRLCQVYVHTQNDHSEHFRQANTTSGTKTQTSLPCHVIGQD